MATVLLAMLAFHLPATAQQPQRSDLGRPGLAQLEATRARPLFSPNRRPPPPPPPVVAPLAASNAGTQALAAAPPAIRLTGVIIGPDRQVAIVTAAADVHPLTIEVGRVIEGWTVVDILPRQIQLRHGDRTVSIGLSPH